jgi:hypothetical protein
MKKAAPSDDQASVPLGNHSRSTRSIAEGEKRECNDKSTRSDEMIAFPTLLLQAPIFRKGVRRPFGNPVVDRYGGDERNQDGNDLASGSDGCEASSGLI